MQDGEGQESLFFLPLVAAVFAAVVFCVVCCCCCCPGHLNWTRRKRRSLYLCVCACVYFWVPSVAG